MVKKFRFNKLLPLAGIAGALFLVSLGLVYVLRIELVKEFTEMYHEYSRILFVAGSVLLIFSGLTVYFRIGKASKKPPAD